MCSVKTNVKKMGRQVIDWEEIFAKDNNKRLLKYKKNLKLKTTTHKKTTQRMGQTPEQTLLPRRDAEDKEAHEHMPHIVCH